MQIGPGVRMGPYEVVASIGAGGMGELYRARDTRLDRTVALKVLPAEFANDTQQRLRFEREAKAISSLNHPNICTLHDVGQQDGVDYLVLEYLEGETLADRIARGPLPLAGVIRYGIEIAAALERAHAAGIVHRDLKPGNVMITKSGAKLLDFGLARVGAVLTPAGSATQATVQKSLTEEGTILGTFQYMAPEQLEGEEADARTDIFALGTVLYEMATGRRAFQGKTRTSLIAAIVDRDPPPISTYQPLTPRTFERVVMNCLAKDPVARWQSAHDVRLELEWLAEAEEATVAPRRRNWLAWSVAAVLALAVVATTALYVWSMMAARRQPPVRTSIVAPKDAAFEFFLEGAPPAISPDGKKIVFGASIGGTRTLWLRTIDSPQPRQLSGTENAGHPFWSPDSRYIAFYSDGFLKKLNAAGGAPVTICPSGPIRGGSWSADGTIVVGQVAGPLMKVSSGGGTLTDATMLDDAHRDITHRLPWFLPDGKHFLFLDGPHTSYDESADVICVGSTTDKKMRKRVMNASSNAAYYDGWILFTRDQLLMAQRLDTKALEVRGDPVALPEQRIEFDSLIARSIFSVSADGTLVYQTGEGLGQTQLTWFDRGGKSIAPVGEPAPHGQFAISHDGSSVAFSVLPRQNIWMYDSRGIKTRLTSTQSRDVNPHWSPDGTKLLFASYRGRYYDIYVKDFRTGSEEALMVSKDDKHPSDWSRDGKYIFYNKNTPANRADIAYFSLEDRKEHIFQATKFAEGGARLSPDGKWLAYWSSESPPRQVYVAPFPATGEKWQVSARGGTSPRWRADGKELYYNGLGKLYAVPIKLGPVPEIGQPAELFDLRFSRGAESWDATPDGQRFLINSRIGSAPAPEPLTLVQHFDSVLREKRD